MGFEPFGGAECEFVKRKDSTLQVVLIVYVGDLLVVGSDIDEVEDAKKILCAKFKLVDLGELQFFLGVRIVRSRNKMQVSQGARAKRLLERFGMADYAPSPTPMQEGFLQLAGIEPAAVEERREMENVPYGTVFGSLLYLSKKTRPDISFTARRRPRTASL